MKKEKNKIKKIIEKIGPGLVTGASDDDPSGILTYLQAGSLFGYSTLWTSLITFPLMAVIQEMSARIGLITGKGLIALLKERYCKVLVFLVGILIFTANTFNIGADILAIGVVLEGLFSINSKFIIGLTAVFILLILIYFPYYLIAKILKWLSLFILIYLLVPFFTSVDWIMVLKSTFIPRIEFNKDFLLILTAILGTTISPYLFFWQANQEVEEREKQIKERKLKRFIVTKHELKLLKEDVFLGMFLSNLVMWFIIVTASSTLGAHQSVLIVDFHQASNALKPLIGEFAFVIFSLGILGTGLLAIPVLAGSAGYALAELFNWQEGLNKSFHEAPGFYLIILLSTVIGGFMNIIEINPISALVYSAVFYGIIAPPLILLILSLANDKKLMKNKTNNWLTNALAGICFLLMSLATIFYLFHLLKETLSF